MLSEDTTIQLKRNKTTSTWSNNNEKMSSCNSDKKKTIDQKQWQRTSAKTTTVQHDVLIKNRQCVVLRLFAASAACFRLFCLFAYFSCSCVKLELSVPLASHERGSHRRFSARFFTFVFY